MTLKTRTLFLARLLSLSLMIGALKASAAVPQVLNHQGRVSVGGENFDGSGQFKFALVNGEGTTSYWSNDGTSNGGAEPSDPVTLAVNKGLYSVLLGDDTLAKMTVIPASALDNDGVHLRVWFSDGSRGFQQFSPDQRLAATPYAVQAVEATGFSGSLAGDVTGTQGATAIAASTVTGKFLTGYVSGAGTLSPSDSILTAINKLNGNDALKADLNNPTFTGTVSGITKSMVGLANVDNTSDADKPVSTAQQAALDSRASNAALNLKAPLASPTFTGTVLFPVGSTTSAPLQLAAGSSLTAPVFGSVEFDGDQLYLTSNAGNPTRRALAFADGQASSVELSTITAAPLKPVVAWGDNGNGQTTVPPLSSVQAIAAGESHSLALLDGGTVVAWGDNSYGQAPVPTGLTDVTAVAAGTNHNLALKADGTVVAWGHNSYGQATVPAGINTATQVAAGKSHSLVLLADGTVRVWGNDAFDQLTPPLALTGVTVTAIAAGEDHSLALTAAGTVIAWGRNQVGQLVVPNGLSGVTAIAAGAHHCLALKSDGTVVAWGWDTSGQSSVPAGLSGVSRISAGYGFSMALKSDRTPVVWGFEPLVGIPEDATQVISIAAGSNHALALRADAIPAQVARLDQDNIFTGKVGIGRTPDTNALEVYGTASKSNAGNWLANSDRRIKAEVESIAGALETLDQVRLVDFRYTEDYLATHPEIEDRRYPNVIAQEFAQVFPDDVKGSGQRLPDGSEILQVDTYPLTIYSAAAVQELHRQNKELKAQLADQEQRLLKLEEILKNK